MRGLVLLALCGSAAACGVDEPLRAIPRQGPPSVPPPPPPGGTDDVVRALVYTRTTGYRHESIADAARLFTTLPPSWGIESVVTDDPSYFDDARLASFDVVVFALTTGDVLDAAGQASLERFVRRGGGFAGVHSAADTEYDWPWYGELVGAYFVSHPAPTLATLTTEDLAHPAIAALPKQLVFTDEWYRFDRNPRADNVLLVTVDGSVFGDADPNSDYPVSWCKEFDGGRSFYTGLGHRPETWGDPWFQRHLLDAIRWTKGPPSWGRSVLTDRAENPLALAVAPDGSVVYIERTGEVLVFDPLRGRVVDAGRLAVDLDGEGGLLGLALDPDFSENRSVYLYFSAAGTRSNVLARFRMRADWTLELESRETLFEVPSERACCHEGGSLELAPDGSLLLATGDNTNPFESGGAAPIDQRPGRELYDATRTAANAFDLRGKILRLTRDGGVPAGNLFPANGSEGRPEIYAMGLRNPFRMAADPRTGRVYFGDLGPDGFDDGPRGPRGYDELNHADAPGDFGWPFCIAENRAFNAWDFATDTPGAPFDCAARRPATLAYDYTTRRHPALGVGYDQASARPGPETPFEGRALLAGTVYAPPPAAPFALPEAFHGQVLLLEWARHLLVMADVDAAGAPRRLERLVPFESLRRPVDAAVGPDGALYVLEYGSEFWGDNADARLSRIEYSATGDLTPLAAIAATPLAGPAPLTVALSAAGSRARGRARSIGDVAWDTDGDGAIDARAAELERRYDSPGVYHVSLVATDDLGRRSLPATARVVVGNTPPEVTIHSPAPGGRFARGSVIELSGSATDPEDGNAACEELIWDVRLGHNAHAHPNRRLTGCQVSLTLDAADHAGAHRLFYAVELAYEDHGGAGGLPSLGGRATLRIDVE